MSNAAPLQERYFFVAGAEARAVEVPVPELWAQLMSGTYTTPQVAEIATTDGWLVTEYEMRADMDSSEMHPDGDELHYLVSGELELVLEEDSGDRVVPMASGKAAVVPRGVWHHFVVRSPGRGVAMTFGRGTQHRPRRS